MMALWLYVVAAAAATFGFLLCGILTSGKTSELEAEVWSLRSQLMRRARGDHDAA